MTAFLRGFTNGLRDFIEVSEASIATSQARDAVIDVALGKRRQRLALDAAVSPPTCLPKASWRVTRPRLSWMASQVSDGFATEERVNAEAAWIGSFVPSAAARKRSARAALSGQSQRKSAATWNIMAALPSRLTCVEIIGVNCQPKLSTAPGEKPWRFRGTLFSKGGL